MALKQPNKSFRLIACGNLNSIPALLLLLCVLSVAIQGQALPTVSRESIKELDFLVGEWKGKGWLYRPQGRKSEISQSTKVKIEPGGLALSLKDKKSFKGADLLGIPMRIPESTISYDGEAKLFRWRVEAAKGRGNPFEAKLIAPRTLQLIIHTPDSMGRTTIEVSQDGQWHETFELLVSEGWVKLHETVLKKVK